MQQGSKMLVLAAARADRLTRLAGYERVYNQPIVCGKCPRPFIAHYQLIRSILGASVVLNRSILGASVQGRSLLSTVSASQS